MLVHGAGASNGFVPPSMLPQVSVVYPPGDGTSVAADPQAATTASVLHSVHRIPRDAPPLEPGALSIISLVCHLRSEMAKAIYMLELKPGTA